MLKLVRWGKNVYLSIVIDGFSFYGDKKIKGRKNMKKSLFSTKAIVATGIGAALFFVLGKFVAIPSGVPNTNLSLHYAFIG